jgi:probable F420-dependent oxidoreductase
MGLGIALPQGLDGSEGDTAMLRDFARNAEAAGFDDLWSIESILTRAPALESLTILSYVAAVTERIRLGTAVLVTNERGAVHLAKALASLDVLSGGRLTVGVGLGGSPRSYATFGVPAERRVSRFVEGIEVLKALWTQPRANLDGRFYHLEDTPMEPKPLQKPHPPLWFGAHVREAMVRAVRLGDGFVGAGSSSRDEFFEELAMLLEVLKEEGRDPATFPRSKRLYITVDDDESAALERLRPALATQYGRPDAADRIAVWGSAAKCAETINRIREAGLTHIFLHPVDDYLKQLEVIATKVAPQI